jgi:hypothetical protein
MTGAASTAVSAASAMQLIPKWQRTKLTNSLCGTMYSASGRTRLQTEAAGGLLRLWRVMGEAMRE